MPLVLLVDTPAGHREVSEAEIRIEGVTLDYGQSMTLRVAMCDFLDRLTPAYIKRLGPVGESYKARAEQIVELIAKGAR